MSIGVPATYQPLSRTDAAVSTEFTQKFSYFPTFPLLKLHRMIPILSIQNPKTPKPRVVHFEISWARCKRIIISKLIFRDLAGRRKARMGPLAYKLFANER